MFLQKITPFSNVGANLPANNTNLPIGNTILGIIIKRGGTAFTNAHLDNIRIRLDGKQIWDITGPHLLTQNKFMNYHLLDYLMSHIHVENDTGGPTDAPTAYASQYDLIAFSDFQARTIGGQLIGALDTSIGYRNMSMEVQIGAATAPTLEAWAIMAPPKAQNDPNKATFRTLLKTIQTEGAAGEFNFEVPLGSRYGALIHKVFMHHTNMTKLQVQKDGLFLLEEGELAMLAFMQAIKNRNPQTGMMVYDPAIDDNQSDTISTLRATAPGTAPQGANFQWKGTLSGSDTVTMYSSLYATIDRI